MTVIARWACHACGKPLASADEPHSPADCDKYRENPVREEVESLRQQLRGAVEALEKIECVYKRTMPGPRDALRDRVLEIIATYRPREP
jgi:hypothetical protein